jgi:hypothetical protein
MPKRKTISEKLAAYAQQQAHVAPSTRSDTISALKRRIMELEAREKELKDGVRLVLNQHYWGGDWINQRRCQSLLSPQSSSEKKTQH